MKRTLKEPRDGAPKTYVSVGLPDVCLTHLATPADVDLATTSRLDEDIRAEKGVSTGVVTGDGRARTDVA